MNSNTAARQAVVLLVEDDVADQELTRRGLQRAGIDVDLRVANDGREALDYLMLRDESADEATHPLPDFVLLDLNMPGLDGRQVLEKMRAEERTRRIPVIVMTTSSEREDVQECYGLGANSYITKPSALDDLTDILTSLQRYWLDTVSLPRC